MAGPLKIALVYPTSLPWMADLLEGVRRYGMQSGGWQLLTCPPSLAASGERPRTLGSLVGWQGDAAIAAIRSDDDRELVRKLGIPIVNLSGWEEELYGVPRVGLDNYEAGRIAAEHLLERGFHHFGYAGWKGVHYSRQRERGFRERVEREGATADVLLEDPGQARHPTLANELKRLGHWLRALPKPCGVLAVQDYRAQLVMEACVAAGLRVPKDVAIVGTDDDAIVCEHSNPTLTSVCRNSTAIGWEAASLIDRMLQGVDVGCPDILVPPEGISERQSTDLFHHPDQVIQLAVAFMLRNLKDSPKVEDVARHAGVSKRTLEMRFKALTGKSPHQYLTAARIDHARKLLHRSSQQNLRRVAVECGFNSYSSFVAAFQGQTGASPSDYRRAQLQSPHEVRPLSRP